MATPQKAAIPEDQVTSCIVLGHEPARLNNSLTPFALSLDCRSGGCSSRDLCGLSRSPCSPRWPPASLAGFIPGGPCQRDFISGCCNHAGWGVAQVGEGKFFDALYGTLPEAGQTVQHALLYALRAVLPWAIPPATIWMDHMNQVNAVQKGCAWGILDDLGGLREVLLIEYTPAHVKAYSAETV